MSSTPRDSAGFDRVRDLLLGELPALSGLDVAVLLRVAGADTPLGLLALDEYLAASPGAILAADAGCPAPVMRLTHVLRDAGLPV